jgi:four helix bundle protein
LRRLVPRSLEQQLATTDRNFCDLELASQIRRAATSIPSNVAEGHAQNGSKIFLRHVRIAMGSLAELDTQLEVAVRLRLLEAAKSVPLAAQMTRTWQLLHGMRRALRAQMSDQQRKPDKR